MADNKIYSAEETITVLTHKVKDLPLGDNFRVKVYRRQGGVNASFGSMLSHVATLGGATLIHIANPETWLPKLCGGGSYMLAVYPTHEPTQIIGSNLPFTYSGEPPHDPDHSVFKSVNWSGPPDLVWPEFKDRADPTLVSMAPSSNQNVPAPLTQAQGGGAGGQSVFGQQTVDRTQDLAFAMRERELNEREARIREEAMRRENELAMTKMRMEHELQMAKIEAQIRQAAQPAPVAAPTPNPLLAIIPAIVPLIQTMIASNNETRMLMIKQQDTAQAQQQALMQVLLTRPPIDPVFEKLINARDNQDSGQMVHSMVDAMSSMTQMSMEAIRTAAEAGGGKQENTGMMVVKEIAKAVEAFASASAGAIKNRQPLHPLRPPHPQPRQIPQGIPLRMPPSGNNAVAPPGQMQRPVPQSGFPQPGFAGFPPSERAQAQEQPQQLQFDHPVDAIEYMIRHRYDPNYISEFTMDNLGHPLLLQELQQYGGDVWAVLKARLGDWLPADPGNQAYIEAVFGAITAKAEARGIVGAHEGTSPSTEPQNPEAEPPGADPAEPGEGEGEEGESEEEGEEEGEYPGQEGDEEEAQVEA